MPFLQFSLDLFELECYFLFCFLFLDRVFLYSPGWPWTQNSPVSLLSVGITGTWPCDCLCKTSNQQLSEGMGCMDNVSPENPFRPFLPTYLLFSRSCSPPFSLCPQILQLPLHMEVKIKRDLFISLMEDQQAWIRCHLKSLRGSGLLRVCPQALAIPWKEPQMWTKMDIQVLFYK